MIWEIIGYAGSAIVLISLLMSSIVKLRIINAVGSLIFCVYALKINSIPTAVMNICIVFIDVYFLIKLLRGSTSFSYCESSLSDPTLKHMIELYKDDIAQFFSLDKLDAADHIYMIFNEDTFAGITAGKASGSEIELLMDYSSPKYRDCKVGKYLHSEILPKSFDSSVYTQGNEKHIPYLEKIGYVKDGDKFRMKLK